MPEAIRILLIDDDEAFLNLTARRLAKSGFITFQATSWADAIPHLREAVDLCLLDVQLISLSGDRLCGILKKSKKGLKVILYSSGDPTHLAELATQSGADGHLSKSLDHRHLVTAIQSFLAAS